MDLAKFAVDGTTVFHFLAAVTLIFAVGAGVDKVFLPGGTQHLEQRNFGRFDDKLAAAGGAACYLHKAAGGKLFENFIGKLLGNLLFLTNLGNAAQLAAA